MAIREIIFKGFHPCTNGTSVIKVNGKEVRGEWLFGDRVKRGGRLYIFPEDGLDSTDNYEVLPETVCEYTGLTDNNGKKIFEGDVVREITRYAILDEINIGEISFRDGSVWIDYGGDEPYYLLNQLDIESHYIEVIGDIFDTKPAEEDRKYLGVVEDALDELERKE